MGGYKIYCYIGQLQRRNMPNITTKVILEFHIAYNIILHFWYKSLLYALLNLLNSEGFC